MAFENQVHVDQHFIRARLREDGTTVEATLFLLPELADTDGATVQAGWAVSVSGSPVEISAGEIDEDGKAVLLTIPETSPGVDVVVSYAAGSGFITGNGLPLISFSNRPVANFSKVAPPVDNAYPLDDDGTVAAAFGYSHAPTNAPDYLRADYTYTDAATGGTSIAAPALANLFGAQAITVGAGSIVACEAVIHSAPSAFGGIGIAFTTSDGGTPTFGVWTCAIRDDDGSTPVYYASGAAATARTSPAAGFRVGLSINGDTGEVIGHTTDGDLVSEQSFTPGQQATFYLFVVDNGDTPNVGNTCSIELVPAAADMQLTYPVGAVDVFGDPV